MKETIGEGKTIDDATENALQEMGATRGEVEIEPLTTGTKGFLGIGRRPATVRAILREDDRIRTQVFMRNILSHMGIDSNIEIQEEGENIVIELDEAASPLIGHRGQTLDSLQYLIARYLNDEKDDWRKVIVDIDDYRNRREDNLKSLAEKLANQAVRSRRNMKTEPLTAPERRIIHMTLKENSDVTTFSVGNGNRKRVVIASNSKGDSSKRRGGGGGGGRSRRGGGGGGGNRGRKSSNRKPVRE